MAADSSKDKVVISASEPITVTIPINNAVAATLCQCCLLCDNTRQFVNGYPPGPSPWVCDECREAIAFVKELKREREEFDPLKPILD